jgi:hypothetical protein
MIAGLDIFEVTKQKYPFYMTSLRMNHREIESMSAHQYPWFGGELRRSLHDRSPR